MQKRKDEEAEYIVITAAKIIINEIREQEYNFDCYPTKEDVANIKVSNKWGPQQLQTFLKILVLFELKQSTIGQCIVQAAGLKSVITPTLFGLGVEMDHVFGSKWLINE